MSEKASYSDAASKGRLGKSATRPPEKVISGAQVPDGHLAQPETNQFKPQDDAAASPMRGNTISSAQNSTQLGSEAPTPTKESPGGTPPAKKQMHATAPSAMPMELSPTVPNPQSMYEAVNLIDEDGTIPDLGTSLRTEIANDELIQVSALQQ